MHNLNNAHSLIIALHSAAAILTKNGTPHTARELATEVMPTAGRAVNMALEKADRVDQLEFDGKCAEATEWFSDIDSNRHRIRLASFGTFLVESQKPDSSPDATHDSGDGWFSAINASEYSAPLRTQGAALSVLARKLMIHPMER